MGEGARGEGGAAVPTDRLHTDTDTQIPPRWKLLFPDYIIIKLHLILKSVFGFVINEPVEIMRYLIFIQLTVTLELRTPVFELIQFLQTDPKILTL